MGVCKMYTDKALDLNITYIGSDVEGFAWEYVQEISKRKEFIGNVTVYDVEGKTQEHEELTYSDILEEALSETDFIIIAMQPDLTGNLMQKLAKLSEIATSIKEYCPKAWVINYTNPMNSSLQRLYEGYPGIKVLGCCQEVFGNQNLWDLMLEKSMAKLRECKVS